MNDRHALLAEIIANPADNGLRMVYADKLDEDATCEAMAARAEFIRCQVRAFEASPDHKPSMSCSCAACRFSRSAFECKRKFDCVAGWFDERIPQQRLPKSLFDYERGFIHNIRGMRLKDVIDELPLYIMYEPIQTASVVHPGLFPPELARFLPFHLPRNTQRYRKAISETIIAYAREKANAMTAAQIHNTHAETTN